MIRKSFRHNGTIENLLPLLAFDTESQQWKHTHLDTHPSCVLEVRRPPVCSVVMSAAFGVKLNFIDKVADNGQQRRTCLVGTSHQRNIWPFFIFVRLPLFLDVCSLHHTSYIRQSTNAQGDFFLIKVNKVSALQ